VIKIKRKKKVDWWEIIAYVVSISAIIITVVAIIIMVSR